MSEMKLGAGKRRRIRNQLRRTSDARQFRRLLAVLECDRGKPVSSVAELLGVSRQSVYNWIERACRQDDPADLREVHGHYRGWHVTMLLDGDSSHTAQASQTLAQRLGMRLLWLPKRSPELNPMEIRCAFAWLIESRSITNIGRTVRKFLVETSFVKKLLITCLGVNHGKEIG